ncbi:hypothetical protein NQZ68_029623 [Dissostichus eleginoides]|nr:hypothetical protein NQZ68_029623 [Dissostichus eleginoides]
MSSGRAARRWHRAHAGTHMAASKPHPGPVQSLILARFRASSWPSLEPHLARFRASSWPGSEPHPGPGLEPHLARFRASPGPV